MKNTRHQIWSLQPMIVLIFFCIGCTKDQPLTPEELILGEWRFTHFYLDTDSVLTTGIPVNDIFPGSQPCEKDNFVVFRPDSTGELNEGASICSPNDPQTRPFTWRIYNDGKELSFRPGYKFDILQLDEKYLKIQTDMMDPITPYYIETLYLERR